jgi:type VI protein secretion system component Hcp
LVLLFLLVAPLSARADTAYLNLQLTSGASCKGASTEANHTNWVILQGFGMGVTNPVTIGTGVGGVGAGRATIAPLKVFKGLDGCTPNIFLWAVEGKILTSVVLETVNNSGAITMRITLTNAIFSSINTNFSGTVQELAGLTAEKTRIATFDVNNVKTEHCYDAANVTVSGLGSPKQ